MPASPSPPLPLFPLGYSFLILSINVTLLIKLTHLLPG